MPDHTPTIIPQVFRQLLQLTYQSPGDLVIHEQHHDPPILHGIEVDAGCDITCSCDAARAHHLVFVVHVDGNVVVHILGG